MRISVAGDDIVGLTLALRLRIKGHDVTVHPDREPRNLPETFTAIAPYRDLFLKSGGALDDCITLIPAQEPMRLVIGGQLVLLPSAGAQRAAIDSAFGAEAATQWAGLLEAAADVWSQVRVGAYQPNSSLRRFAMRTLRHPRLRELLIAIADGVPRRSDAAIVQPYLIQTFGLWQFDGGMPRFLAVLRDRCEQRGVEFVSAPAPHDAMSIDLEFAHMFSAPGLYRRKSSLVRTQELGLTFVGMAADAMAERIGRA